MNKTLLGFVFLLAIGLHSTCSFRQAETDALQWERDSLLQLIHKKDSVVSLPHTIVHPLISDYTKEEYDIYISYPDDYKTSQKEYPVLVVLDAEVNFGAVTYIVHRLVKDELIPELFVVGIAYHGETSEDTYYSTRAKDFTPTADKAQEDHNKTKYQLGSGGAENFVKFLSHELFPFLTNNFPVKEKGKTIYGHSFGGLFGSYVLLDHPELFDNYLLLSPSLWWDDKILFKNEKLNSPLPSTIKLYLATGSEEGTMVNDHVEMASILKRVNSGNLKMKSEILDHETHRTIFGRGFTSGLRFLYEK